MDRISHYRVVSRIGAGGMGVVWRAVDERLGREVAIKVLGRNSSSPERAIRMMREAQAASALNHPGIVTVHDVGEFKGQPYVVMELIEGVRFSDLGRQPPAEALRLCALAADALGAAHARGILHRDIKSDNLMRLPDERVKVLDFGLAKVTGDSVTSSGVRSITPVSGTAATMAGDSGDPKQADADEPEDDEPDDGDDDAAPGLADTMASGSGAHPASPSGGYVRPAASSAELTRVGDIMGTPAYMSPEQARGLPADGRSEVFSLGVVLYELLTGRRPFLGTTVEETLEAVREAVVTPPSKVTRDPALAPYDAMLATILARDPFQRPADMTALAALLRAPTNARPARSARRLWALGGAVIALGVGGVALAKLGSGHHAVASRKDAGSAAAVKGIRADRRLTLDDGCEEFPVISADGELVMFDASHGADYDIVALDRLGVRRTLVSDPGWNMAAALSPDGKHLAFLRKAGAPYQAVVTELGASTPPRVITQGGSRPSWSPDGKAVWAGSGRKPQRFNLETGAAERTLTPPDGWHALATLELPDSTVLGLMLQPDTNSTPQGVARFSTTGEMTWLYQGEIDEVLTLSPDKQGVIVSHLTTSNRRELLVVPLDGGKATPFAADVEAHKGLSASSDWSRVVWSDCVERTEISTVRKTGADYQFGTLAGGTWADIDPVPLADRRQLVVISDRSNDVRPWLIDLDGNVQPRMIVDVEPTRIAVTPDASTLVYEVDGDGIYKAPIAGGTPTKLAAVDSLATPAVGPDARVYFSRGDDMAVRIFTVPLAGGAATPLLPAPCSLPAPSPVGHTLVYAKGDRPRAELVVRDLSTSSEHPLAKELPAGGWTYLRFSADGRKIAATRGQSDVFVIELATGKVLDHVVGRSRTFNSAALLGPHGDELLVGTLSWNGDIWVGAAER